MQKATRARGLGTSPLPSPPPPASTKVRQSNPEHSRGSNFTKHSRPRDNVLPLLPFVSPPFPQSSSTLCQWSLWRKRGWGLVVPAGEGVWRKEGYVWSGLAFPHHPQKAPPLLGSFLTWSTNETPWDPRIAPFTAAQHPFIAQPLCNLRLFLRWHFWGQCQWTEHQPQCRLRTQSFIKDLLWSCHCFSGLTPILRHSKGPNLFWPRAKPLYVQQ